MSASDVPPPPDPERLARGTEMFERVYAGVIPVPPPGLIDFADIMLGQLFAEQWARPQLAMRDRRLLTLAVIASVGDADTWAIHLEAALRNEELTPDEARETVIHLAQYVGYPRASPLLMKTEVVLAKVAAANEADQGNAADEEPPG